MYINIIEITLKYNLYRWRHSNIEVFDTHSPIHKFYQPHATVNTQSLHVIQYNSHMGQICGSKKLYAFDLYVVNYNHNGHILKHFIINNQK